MLSRDSFPPVPAVLQSKTWNYWRKFEGSNYVTSVWSRDTERIIALRNRENKEAAGRDLLSPSHGKNPYFPFNNAADKKLADIILKAGMTNTPVNELLQFFLTECRVPGGETSTKHGDITEYLKKMPLEGFQEFDLTPALACLLVWSLLLYPCLLACFILDPWSLILVALSLLLDPCLLAPLSLILVLAACLLACLLACCLLLYPWSLLLATTWR